MVEDKFTLEKTLTYNLKHQGYEVETANDSQATIIMQRYAIWIHFGNTYTYILVSRRNTRV